MNIAGYEPILIEMRRCQAGTRPNDVERHRAD